MSEQKAEPTSGESGSAAAGPAIPTPSDTIGVPISDSTQEPAGLDAPKLAAAQGEADKTSGIDASKMDAPKADAPRAPGSVMIMSPGDRSWHSSGAGKDSASMPNSGMLGKRRIAALAAVVALAALAGALGGALATAGFGHPADEGAATVASRTLEASVARIDADIAALKAGLEHATRVGVSQYNKTSDRLDKVEKAQLEPAARLAKLSDAVDKLRAAPPVASAPVAAAPAASREVTGSVSPPATTAPAAAPKTEVARLPAVEGWVLRDVANGGALIEGRQGIYEVYAGDPVPGLGRVDAIRRQDGRWVVVTSKGLIVAR